MDWGRLLIVLGLCVMVIILLIFYCFSRFSRFCRCKFNHDTSDDDLESCPDSYVSHDNLECPD